MALVDRVKSILLNPKPTWAAIEAEPATPAGLYKDYLVWLAAIPALCGFIGMSLIGFNVLGHTVRVPLFSGIVNMVVSYVLSLAMIYLLALLADRLAPNFGGEKSMDNAMKLIAYSSTAGMVGGIFSLIPGLSILGFLTALYSLYLLFLGVPVMMKAPQERALSYTAILLVGGLLAGAVLGLASAIFR